jgi:hypothetical protein
MANSTQLITAARAIARRHPNNNPLLNPGAMAQFNASDQALIRQVAASPQHAAIATTPVAGGAPASAGVGGSEPLASHQLQRTPNTRHNLVGFGASVIAANALTGVSATAYSAFKATRMIIAAPTFAAAGTNTGLVNGNIGNWKVGSKSQFAAVGMEPMGLFATGLNGGRLRFSRAMPAIPISAQVTVGATATFYACLIGTAAGRKDNKRPPPQYAKEDRVYIPATFVNAGSSTTVEVAPTRSFWATKVVLDDTQNGTFGLATGTGASSFVMPDLLVGSDSQFMSAPPVSGAAAPIVPAGVFNGLWSPNLDFDKASTAVPYAFEITNVGGATALFMGVMLGDVDKRADVEDDSGEEEQF